MPIGSVKTIPSPGSKVMEEALSLLSAFGKGGGDNQKLLEKMKEVQVHNEKVYKDITAAIKENSQLVAEAKKLNTEDRAAIAEEAEQLNQAVADFVAREAEQEDRNRTFNEEAAQFAIERANIEARLSQRDEIIKKAAQRVELDRMTVDAELSKARVAEEQNESKRRRLNEVKARLSAILSDIENI